MFYCVGVFKYSYVCSSSILTVGIILLATTTYDNYIYCFTGCFYQTTVYGIRMSTTVINYIVDEKV